MQRWNAEYEDASLILNQKEKRKQLDRLAEQIEKVQQGLVHPTLWYSKITEILVSSRLAYVVWGGWGIATLKPSVRLW